MKIKAKREIRKTILETIAVVELSKPTSSGYTHGLMRSDGECAGFLEPTGKPGYYRLHWYDYNLEPCVPPGAFRLEDVAE